MSGIPDMGVFEDHRVLWPRLRRANAVQTGDPNGLEDPADRFADVVDADGNQYIEGSLLGGIGGFNDPGDSFWLTFAAADIFGRNATATELWKNTTTLRERLAPGLATDSYVVVGVCSEANLASATVDALGVGIVYSGGTRTLRACVLVNGGVVNASPAANAALRRAYSDPNRIGGLNVFGVNGCSVATDAGADLGSSLQQGYNVNFSAGTLHLFLAFGRTAATAGTALLGASAFGLLYPAPGAGRLPT